jgi:hypothetical protein
MEKSLMEKMQDDIHELKALVEKLYAVIAGHELDRESGLVHQVKDHETRITDLEEKVKKAFWIAIGALPAGFGFSEFIRAIITKVSP